ncbi:MAG: hypothetical protein ACTSRA_00950 [Promethearchaeota archaeon]|nr:MAG: metallo-dependent phosphatase [Helarchaeota virus Nidhogg Meg22_1012]URC17346.1 MAG: metallo-dependent phosphatase [Helarchaeota virus Nidhogg Meg22_1214]
MKWTEEEIETLRDNFQDLSYHELNELLVNRSLGAIKNMAWKLGLKKTPKVTMEPKLSIDATGEQLFLDAISHSINRRELHDPLNEITAEFKIEDYPFGIILVVTSDWHLGNINTDYGMLKNDLDIIDSVPDAFAVMVGDVIDNFKPVGTPLGGQHEALYTLQEQKKMASYLFKRYGENFIGIFMGCHDHWSYKIDGWDITETYSEDILGSTLGHGGYLNIVVGDVMYKIYARHKYRYNSSLNLTHSVKKMHDEHGPFDIGILAHHHAPAFEVCEKQGKKFLAICNGTYKGIDDYARKIGYREGTIGCTAIYLSPDRKAAVPFSRLEDAVIYLKGNIGDNK